VTRPSVGKGHIALVKRPLKLAVHVASFVPQPVGCQNSDHSARNGLICRRNGILGTHTPEAPVGAHHPRKGKGKKSLLARQMPARPPSPETPRPPVTPEVAVSSPVAPVIDLEIDIFCCLGWTDMTSGCYPIPEDEHVFVRDQEHSRGDAEALLLQLEEARSRDELAPAQARRGARPTGRATRARLRARAARAAPGRSTSSPPRR
jgi:hypothetical protein